MESVYRFSEAEIVTFALVLIRLSAFIVTWPVFGVENVPGPVKVLLSLALGLVVFPTLNWRGLDVNFYSSALIWMAVREAFVGLVIGFLGKMFLMATQIAGDLISVSLGLTSAQVFNPSMGGQSTPVDQLFYTLAALVFLAINGHHLFITAIIDTFRVVPIGPALLSTKGLAEIGGLVQEVVSIGIRMSSPVVISILIVNLILGVLGKAVPQINVLVTGLAINVMVGMLVLIVALPTVLERIPDIMESSAADIFRIVKSF